LNGLFKFALNPQQIQAITYELDIAPKYIYKNSCGVLTRYPVVEWFVHWSSRNADREYLKIIVRAIMCSLLPTIKDFRLSRRKTVG